MGELVKIVECPRDAWQGLPALIPAAVKTDYLQRLISAGFTHIDAVSFVSPAAVPQMSDSEEVLKSLARPDAVELIAIVVNAKGADRAIRTEAVQTLGFPYSISPQFLKRNQNQTQEEALEVLQQITKLASNAGLDLVAYVSMAFGNPYGDKWEMDKLTDGCHRLVEFGVRQISLADTVGLATPSQIMECVAQVVAELGEIEIGVHLHARPEEATAKIRAAYEAGCGRFDAAIGGLGGCPFAQDALVGNIPTEMLLTELKTLGAQVPDLARLEPLIQASADIAEIYGRAHLDRGCESAR
jgi:hydroxymethylglutaryl-CoA lyase